MKKPAYLRVVGIHYEGGADDVPSVGVKGELALADQAVKLAKRFGVPVIENAELARAMESIPLDEEIPSELFEAVATVLNHVGRVG